MSWFNPIMDYIAPNFFRRSPFRSSQFIAGTIMMLLCTAIGCTVLVLHWSELYPFPAPFVCLALVVIPVLWIRALQEHSRVRRIFNTGTSVVPPGSPADQAMRAAASMIYYGLLYAFLADGFLSLALLAVLHRCSY